MTCTLCGNLLVSSSELYLVCPNGHGKLVLNDKAKAGRVKRELSVFAKKVDVALGFAERVEAQPGRQETP